MKAMNCEQLFNVWSTDPQMIMILDIRPREEYMSCRIPGSIHAKKEEIIKTLQDAGDKLLVILGSELLSDREVKELSDHENLIFIEECSRWMSLGLPLVGNDVIPKKQPFRLGTLGVYPLSHGEQLGFLVVDPMTTESCYIGTSESLDIGKLSKAFGVRILYRFRTEAGGTTILECRENPAASQRFELEDGQVLLLGEKALSVIFGPSGDFFVQFEDKAIALNAAGRVSNEGWSLLGRVMPFGLVYHADDSGNLSTSLMEIDQVKHVKGV